MARSREIWKSGWLEATAYDFVVEREPLAGAFGRLIWGVEAAKLYRDIARLADAPDGTSILDIPCGGGVAFRGLRTRQKIRYVAADLSPVMLDRARAEARRRRLEWIEFVEADVEALPFEDRSFELCISYTGLHCFPDPAAAIAEMARVLKASGELRGSCVVRERGLRQGAFIRLAQRAAVFGPCGTASELGSWLEAAGLRDASIELDGALSYFSARRPAP